MLRRTVWTRPHSAPTHHRGKQEAQPPPVGDTVPAAPWPRDPSAITKGVHAGMAPIPCSEKGAASPPGYSCQNAYLNLITRKHQTHPNWRTVYTLPGQYSSEVSRKANEEREAVPDNKTRRGHDNWVLCVIWVRKKDFSDTRTKPSKAYRLIGSVRSTLISRFDHWTRVMKILTFGKTG